MEWCVRRVGLGNPVALRDSYNYTTAFLEICSAMTSDFFRWFLQPTPTTQACAFSRSQRSARSQLSLKLPLTPRSAILFSHNFGTASPKVYYKCADDDLIMGTDICGKPVHFVETTILNERSGFVHKRLCNGPTFSAGTACAFSCTYCYRSRRYFGANWLQTSNRIPSATKRFFGTDGLVFLFPSAVLQRQTYSGPEEWLFDYPVACREFGHPRQPKAFACD